MGSFPDKKKSFLAAHLITLHLAPFSAAIHSAQSRERFGLGERTNERSESIKSRSWKEKQGKLEMKAQRERGRGEIDIIGDGSTEAEFGNMHNGSGRPTD